MKNGNESLIVELEKLLKGGGAHVEFNDAIANQTGSPWYNFKNAIKR